MELSAVTAPGSPSDSAAEVHVDIDTHGAEIDVRQALAFLADKGKLSLIFSPDINKKVRLQLHDVPVSQALQAVLASAGLTLENMNGATTPGPTSSVVFYQLPVNVDSLSVEGVMKAFGVGRTAAELIVQQRTNKP
jgi:type II secretory pathway component HofQ